MKLRSLAVGSFVALSLLAVTGCPTAPVDTGPSPFQGTWMGTLDCTRTQSVGGGAGGAPHAETLNITITFGEDGAPADVLILNYADGADLAATISRTGDTATVTSDAGVVATTLGVEVTSAGFSSTRIEMAISIDYSGTSNTLTQSGTGTQSLTATLAGDSLSLTLNVDYDVTQTVGSINLLTNETTDCTGTLTRQ